MEATKPSDDTRADQAEEHEQQTPVLHPEHEPYDQASADISYDRPGKYVPPPVPDNVAVVDYLIDVTSDTTPTPVVDEMEAQFVRNGWVKPPEIEDEDPLPPLSYYSD